MSEIGAAKKKGNWGQYVGEVADSVGSIITVFIRSIGKHLDHHENCMRLKYIALHSVISQHAMSNESLLQWLVCL